MKAIKLPVVRNLLFIFELFYIYILYIYILNNSERKILFGIEKNDWRSLTKFKHFSILLFSLIM